MRRYDDPVEVRRGHDSSTHEEGPEQFLWRGRLWQVREVVGHWVETGAWWARPARPQDLDRSGLGAGSPGAHGLDGDLLREREVWRVTAARGQAVAREDDPGFGVFDLSFDWSDGSWQLARTAD